MGMTIEEIISVLDDMKVKIDIPKAAVMQNNKNYALDVAIDTMRKYQKIAELYDYWRSGKCEYTISCMENIGKVLRDGNDN